MARPVETTVRRVMAARAVVVRVAREVAVVYCFPAVVGVALALAQAGAREVERVSAEERQLGYS